MSLRGILLAFMLATLSCCFATSDEDKDKEECTEQLVGLATCLPYVGGKAKSPTPDCCSGLKQVLKVKKKCLCVIVKDRNDPDLGLSINVTLALGLPSVCHAPANVSQCPALLHLAPNSSDAQVFYQFGPGSNSSASSPIPSVKANSTTAASSSGTPSVPQKSDGSRGTGKRWLQLE
ncbi:hypothetical protein RJ639_037707, partial [Escallonia herrerae]